MGKGITSSHPLLDRPTELGFRLKGRGFRVQVVGFRV